MEHNSPDRDTASETGSAVHAGRTEDLGAQVSRPTNASAARSDIMTSVRAIAHPLRIRIYELLVLAGPMTVSVVADRLGVAIGSASYHLERLGDAGYVEEALDKSAEDKRTRWWRVASGGLEWNPAHLRDVPGGPELSSAANALLVERRATKMMDWARQWHTWTPDWIDAAEDADTYLDLSSDELREMKGELAALITRWHQRRPNSSGVPSGDVQRVFLTYSVFPVRSDGTS